MDITGNDFWATVCKTVRHMLSDHCPVCLSLSVTFVHCGQTAGWIKMKLGMWVGLSPGHIVLDGDPATIFRPYLSRPNGCMDQDATWYGARPWPRQCLHFRLLMGVYFLTVHGRSLLECRYRIGTESPIRRRPILLDRSDLILAGSFDP